MSPINCIRIQEFLKSYYKIISLFVLSAVPFDNNKAQGIVDVDLFKGRAQVSIPVYTLKKGDISIPISLDYIAKGIQVNEEGKRYGLGWGLNAGGAISRRLKDLPDDRNGQGWLFNNNASIVESFSIANDNNPLTCNDEVSDVNYLTSYFPINQDSEPDVFEVSAPGVSCTIIFDRFQQPKTIPYNDFKITYTTDTYGINSFRIVNDQGMIYNFAVPDLASRTTKTSKASVPYFSRDYNQYKTKIQYYANWYLQKITDAKGNVVTFSYGNNVEENNTVPLEIIERNGSSAFTKNILYDVITTGGYKRLRNIDGGINNGLITLEYNGQGEFPTRINLPTGNNLSMTYSEVNQRFFLKEIRDFGCGPNALYSFEYNGENSGSSVNKLPPISSVKQDPWGYYNASSEEILTPKIYIYPSNGSSPNQKRYRFTPIPNYAGPSFVLPGASRVVNPSSALAGSLSKIIYPTGGSTSLQYESNTYFDNDLNNFQNGGGIRIKSIIDYDGLDISKNIVKEYEYFTPGTSTTSGKVISMPSLAFTKAQSGTSGSQDYWELSTARSENDLSIESTDVIYSSVTVRQSGLGKVVYEYNTPATFWDPVAPDWSPSVNYFGRPNCVNGTSAPMGDLVNTSHSYPYTVNPNYDFERGLIKVMTAYNENNAPVKKEEFSYQRSNVPQVISGLKIDDINSVKAYSKYKFLTSTINLMTVKKIIDYDLNDASKFSQSSTSFVYGSSSHKKSTRSSVTNSDGVIKNSYIKYVKDYVSSNTGDAINLALKGMKETNVNLPVEIYNSIRRPGGTEVFISGELSTYKVVAASGSSGIRYLPFQFLQFVRNSGVSSFQPSLVNAQGIFVKDQKYILLTHHESYSQNGLSTTVSRFDKGLVSNHFKLNTGLPLAQIINAKHDQVVFSGFDSDDPETSFGLTNPKYVPDSRTGSNALSVAAGSVLSKALKKGNTKNYVFSCWIKSNSGGTISIGLTNSANSTATSSLAYTINSSWKYYEVLVPVQNMTESFSINLRNSTSIIIDDVLFYPETADLTSRTYNLNGDKLSQTKNGISEYYEYDRIGKLKLVRDQDLNIIRRESTVAYNTSMDPASISYPIGDRFEGDNILFTAGIDYCISGVNYSWNFGDGTAPVNTTGNSINHIYAKSGTYNVTLTKSHADYGSQTTIVPIIIKPKSLVVQICSSGVINFDNCRVDAPLIQTCPGLPLDETRTTFTVSGISGCASNATYTYQWEKSEDNGLNWIVLGITSTTYSSGFINTARPQKSYQVRCKVTSSCGKSGIGTSEFIAYSSTPNCL